MEPVESENPPDQGNDIIVSLLATPFKNRSKGDREKIIINGRPTPSIEFVSAENRIFEPHYYNTTKWLCGSAQKQGLYCWPCMLMCPDSTKRLTKDGYKQFKNVHAALNAHSCSKNHMESVMKLKKLAKPIFQKLEFEKEQEMQRKLKLLEEVDKNRKIFKILFEVLSTLCKQGIGYNDTIDIGKLIEDCVCISTLILKRDPELVKHWESTPFFNQMPATTPGDMMECLGDGIEADNSTLLTQAKFYSCMMDEAIDNFGIKRTSLVARLVDSKGQVRECFWGLYETVEDTADSLCCVLSLAFSKYSIKEKLIALSYNGASASIEELAKLQDKLHQIAPLALFTYCFSSHLNLILQNSCTGIAPVNSFFSILQGMFSFFQTPNRAIVLNKIFGKSNPITSGKDWDANSKLLTAIHTNRIALIEVLETLLSTEDPITKTEITLYLKNLRNYAFNLFLSVFQSVFEKTETLYECLLNNDPDISAIRGCVSAIGKMKRDESFDEFDKLARSLSVGSLLDTNGTQYNSLDQVIADSSELSAAYIADYKRVYLAILNDILKQIEVRFENVGKMTFLSLAKPREPVNGPAYIMGTSIAAAPIRRLFSCPMRSLDAHYGCELLYTKNAERDKLKSELQFINSDIIRDELQSSDMGELIRKMIEDSTHEVIPEVHQVFRLVATLPSCNTTISMGGPCSTRVRQFLKKCKNHEAITVYSALTYIEKEVLRELETRDPSWYDNLTNRYIEKTGDVVNLAIRDSNIEDL